MAYAEIPGSTNLSQLVALGDQQNEAMRSYERSTLANAPSVKPVGLIWNQTDDSALGEAWKRWNGSNWTLLLDPEAAQLNAAGTVALAANLPAGGFVLTGLGAGTANGHSVRYQQVVRVDESTGALLADLDAGGKKITDLAAPESDNDAARRIDAQAPGDGLAYFNAECALSLADGDEHFEPVGWVPRAVTLRVYGQVRRISDNQLWGTIDVQTATAYRWNPDAGAGFPAPEWVTVASETVGAQTIQVQVKFRHDDDPAGQGFWVRLLRGFDEYHTVDVLQCWAVHARGM